MIGYSISGNSVQNGEPTPDNPIEVESTGEYDEETGKYKIPIKMSGKNLIDKESISTNIYFKRNGDIFISNRGIYADRVVWRCNVSVLDAGNYVLSADVKQADITTDPSASTVILGVRSNSKTIKEKYNTVVREEWVRVNLEFTLTESIENFTFQIQPLGMAGKFDNLNLQIKNIQLEKSNTMGDYEPYIEPIYTNIFLDEPLRKVGAYADYIDFEREKVVRRVSEGVFNGDESWYHHQALSDNRYSYALSGITPIMSAGNKAVLSNMFTYSDAYAKNTILSYTFTNQNGWISATVSSDEFRSVAAFKTFLANKFVEGNPLKVYLVMPEKEQPITLPKLPTHKGTTVYSIETAIQPTNMSATYYSTSKE